MIHEFTLVIDGCFSGRDFGDVADQFAAAFANGDVVPHTRHGEAFAEVYRDSDKPLKETIREVIDQVRQLGYQVKGVQIVAAEEINRELAGAN